MPTPAFSTPSASPSGPVTPGIPTNLGIVDGDGTQVSSTPTIGTSGYISGDVLGGVLTFKNILNKSTFNGLLESITLRFAASLQTGSFVVAIFTKMPSGTFTDNAPAAIAAGDSANLLGVYALPTPISNLGTHTIFNLDGICKQIVGSTADLYVVVVATAAVTNPASASDMSLQIGVVL